MLGCHGEVADGLIEGDASVGGAADCGIACALFNYTTTK